MLSKLGRLRAIVCSWKVKDVIISFQMRFQLDQTAKYMVANEKKIQSSAKKNPNISIPIFFKESPYEFILILATSSVILTSSRTVLQSVPASRSLGSLPLYPSRASPTGKLLYCSKFCCFVINLVGNWDRFFTLTNFFEPGPSNWSGNHLFMNSSESRKTMKRRIWLGF